MALVSGRGAVSEPELADGSADLEPGRVGLPVLMERVERGPVAQLGKLNSDVLLVVNFPVGLSQQLAVVLLDCTAPRVDQPTGRARVGLE